MSEDMSDGTPQFQNSVDVKLDYLQRDMREIKGDIKDIKNDFINRREFTEGLNEVRNQIAPIRKALYWAAAVVGASILGALLRLVIQ